MTALGAIAFEKLYASLPDARAQLRVGTDIIARAITAGLMVEKESGNLGVYEKAQMTVRFLAADEPARARLLGGKLIDVNVAEQGWQRVRVMGRKVIAGLITLNIETQFE